MEATPKGEEVSEYSEGRYRYNAFENVETYSDNLEPECEPRSLVARTRRGRVPATYPSLQEDEFSGLQYPGEGVDLSRFTDKERMMRLLECIQARMFKLKSTTMRRCTATWWLSGCMWK